MTLVIVTLMGRVVCAETTFPVDEAGIAAYVNIGPIEAQKLTEAANFFTKLEKVGEDYVIGTYNINGIFEPHVYVGLDGWVVSYYLKNEESSRIVQLNTVFGDPSYIEDMSNTNLLRTITDLNLALYDTASRVEDVKYYNFAYPAAKKMVVIRKDRITGKGEASFQLSVPATIYEASWAVDPRWRDSQMQQKLFLDGNLILDQTNFPSEGYAFFDLNNFRPFDVHTINYAPPTLPIDNHYCGSVYVVITYGD